MLPASRSGTTRIFARPATVDAICLTAAASTLIALSSVRAPSSWAPSGRYTRYADSTGTRREALRCSIRHRGDLAAVRHLSLQRAGHDASARCRDHGGRTAHPSRKARSSRCTRRWTDAASGGLRPGIATYGPWPTVRNLVTVHWSADPDEVVATRDLAFYDALGRRLGQRSMA
jgi:hypothetical protein